jgi:archaellum component FlaF (FlaF/FlaG flagellin family)
VGEDLSAPYTYDHQAFEFGSFNLVARAIDNAGGAINSSPLNFIVNAPPIIAFSSPSNSTKAQPGESLTLSVNASDPDGNVAKVEFFQNGEKFGEVLGSPFSLKTSALKSGPYIFAARATDNRGFTTNATPVSLVVNALPVALITNPSKDTSIRANTPLSIRINATDADGEIEKVELLLNGQKVGEDGQAPYLIQLNNLPIGVQNLSVRVWDDLGDQQVSAIRKVTVLQSTPVSDVQLKRIKAFPNPCAEVLFLEGWKAGERLQIFNLAGSLVAEYLAAPQLDLGKLRPGSYLVRGKDGAAFALIRR